MPYGGPVSVSSELSKSEGNTEHVVPGGGVSGPVGLGADQVPRVCVGGAGAMARHAVSTANSDTRGSGRRTTRKVSASGPTRLDGGASAAGGGRAVEEALLH